MTGKYIPSRAAWVREQVELYEGSNGTEGTTLKESGLPVIIVTHRGRKTGAIRKTPLMRAVDGSSYILVASQGGAPIKPKLVLQLGHRSERRNPRQGRSLLDEGSRSFIR